MYTAFTIRVSPQRSYCMHSNLPGKALRGRAKASAREGQ
jgi:hypothetical protein